MLGWGAGRWSLPWEYCYFLEDEWHRSLAGLEQGSEVTKLETAECHEPSLGDLHRQAPLPWLFHFRVCDFSKLLHPLWALSFLICKRANSILLLGLWWGLRWSMWGEGRLLPPTTAVGGGLPLSGEPIPACPWNQECHGHRPCLELDTQGRVQSVHGPGGLTLGAAQNTLLWCFGPGGHYHEFNSKRTLGRAYFGGKET